MSSVAVVCLLFAYVPLLQDYYYYDYKGSSVVRITYKDNLNAGGSGFQVEAPSGLQYIITNKHVCAVANEFGEVMVSTTTGERKVLRVLDRYKEHDLCVIEPFEGLRPMRLASNIYRSERVYLIGHPRLADLTFERGYFRGKKKIQMRIGWFDSFSFNLIAYGGNSGSPIIDVYGNVVSVLFAGSPSYPNFTYGVPLRYIRDFLKDK